MDSIGAVQIEDLVNTFQIMDNVGVVDTDKLLQCLMVCLRTLACITIFFNRNTHQCIMHSKTFHFRRPNQSGVGWEVYRLIDETGRCPWNFLYYRHLDLCYRIENGTTLNMQYTDHRAADNQCKAMGSNLVRIDSSDKQSYMKHVLDGITEDFVCIQGNNFRSPEYTFDDRTKMEYLNWAAGHPNGGVNRLAMKPTSMCWHGLPVPSITTCSFVCEIK